jgi:hypothetical protein
VTLFFDPLVSIFPKGKTNQARKPPSETRCGGDNGPGGTVSHVRKTEAKALDRRTPEGFIREDERLLGEAKEDGKRLVFCISVR